MPRFIFSFFLASFCHFSTPPEIKAIFTKLRVSLDDESRRLQSSRQREAHFQELLPFLRKQFFSDLVLGLVRQEAEINRRATLFECGIDIHGDPCCLISLQIENHDAYLQETWGYGSEGLNNAGYNFFEGVIDQIRYFPVFDDSTNWFILAAGTSGMAPETMRGITDAYLGRKVALMQDMLHLQIHYQIEAQFPSLMDLAQKGRPTPPTQADTSGALHSQTAQLTRLQDLFLSYMNACDREAQAALVSEYLALIAGNAPDMQRLALLQLFMVVELRMRDNGVHLASVTDCVAHRLRLLSGQGPIPSEEMICQALSLISQELQDKTSGENNAIIDKAVRYPEENCTQDITLRDVANHVFLSPTYFSQFFKSNLGMTFSEYLLKTRMEHAVRLLKNPESKIQDIGILVGYTDSKYFSRLFKRNTGLTPSEYRQKYLVRGRTA